MKNESERTSAQNQQKRNQDNQQNQQKQKPDESNKPAFREQRQRDR